MQERAMVASGTPWAAPLGRLDPEAAYSARQRQLRSGAGVLGSIPGIALALGAFVVLTMFRLAGVMLQLKEPSQVDTRKNEEEPMKLSHVIGSVAFETAWVLLANVVAGLLLLS